MDGLYYDGIVLGSLVYAKRGDTQHWPIVQ